jgi:uncharacterized protein (UPF0548 family)
METFATEVEGDATLCSYPGSTQRAALLPRRGWWINRSRESVGHGQAAFARASRALAELEVFEQPWLTAHRRHHVLSIGSRQFGCLWVMNANFVLHSESNPRSESVTFGTTTRHVLAGEERLSLRWDPDSDDVSFEVLSFSRPRHLFSWACYPYVLAQQRRFARDATASMKRAVMEQRQHAVK